MMAEPWIDLYEARQYVGTFDLPRELVAPDGHRFRLMGAVDGGGNGVVFEARQVGDAGQIVRTCAIKILRQLDEVKRDRFANEVRILRELRHDRITALYGAGSVSLGRFELPWAAIELGGDNLRRHVRKAGPIGGPRLVKIGVQICQALSHLHERGLVHRDVKPGNFVLERDDSHAVLMIDFGIAKRLDEDVSGRPMDALTRTAEFVGPQFFSSPEQIAYADDKTVIVDSRSDLFQLGRVLWFLATEKISAGIPSRRDCPFAGSLHDVVLRLVCDEPDDRIPTADAVRQYLLKLAPTRT